MPKRHSSRRSSLSPGSPMVEHEDDGVADVASKPSKRIKMASGSAVPASPGSTAADVAPEDEEMKEAHEDDDEPALGKAKTTGRPERRKSARSGAKAEADSANSNNHNNHNNHNNDDDTLEIEQEADADADAADVADAADPDATVMISSSHGHDSNSKSNGNTNGTRASAVTRNGAGGDDHLETMSTISEDTDGEVPPPKKTAQAGEDDPTSILNAINEPQVTVCAWDGCEAGDIGTMDKLVEHLHAEHVEGKQRRYTCEWIGCPRKGKSHASAYALKAHLRSHTREKPHVCLLPECDLAFARQDALNKHMRTSHEIDMMRYYEAGQRRVPIGARTTASGSSANGSAANGVVSTQVMTTTNGKTGPSKLKIIIKTPQSHAAGHDDSVDSSAHNGAGGGGSGGGAGSGYDDTSLYHYTSPGSETTVLAKDQGFTSHELELSPKELYGVCRMQLQWAEDESEELRNECTAWEEAVHKAWLEQQVLLEQVIVSEKDWYERRKAVLASFAIEEEKRAAEEAAREVEEDAAVDDDGDNDNDNDNDDVKDEDDSGADDGDDGDDVDGEDDDDDDAPSVMLDPDATRDDYSFAETTSFSVVGGSSLRNEVAVNGD
ncbi:hypothetical protein SCUCBS95973_005209 [Sporothrix curviconia]|uniref:C2H2-type domain-containing protein n=1 Tax=Sporothrix curviconia TaxID=1260050 RepID=A0ABP0BVC2_9PEZI